MFALNKHCKSFLFEEVKQDGQAEAAEEEEQIGKVHQRLLSQL